MAQWWHATGGDRGTGPAGRGARRAVARYRPRARPADGPHAAVRDDRHSLARRLGLSDERQAVAYYATLLAWIGCHADSHELSAWFGDDIAFRADTYDVDWAGLPFAWLLASHVGRDRPALARAGRAAALFGRLRGNLRELMSSHCLSAGALAERAGLGDDVGRALAYTFERWDGSGLPAGIGGADIPREMHIAHVADVAEVHLRRAGVEHAERTVRARSGTQFDPAVVAAFTAGAAEIAAELAVDDVWQAALDRAPDRDLGRRRRSRPAAHRRGRLRRSEVPGDGRPLASGGRAGGRCRAPVRVADPQVRVVRRAALMHDIGRMGVPNSIWDRPGRPSDTEWERVRLYPYLTGRILSRIDGFAEIAGVAGAHHERMDGSGYPRGLSGAALSPAQRVLAAADVYRSLREDRPYRRAHAAPEAASLLRTEVRAGRLDGPAVEAVLEAAGEPVRRRRTWPAGLTEREVDVLRLVARGEPNAAIAAALRISEKTVRNHVEHIYTKIDVNNRTGASLFATRHGIADDPHRQLPET